jgi:hypothetical protein
LNAKGAADAVLFVDPCNLKRDMFAARFVQREGGTIQQLG